MSFELDPALVRLHENTGGQVGGNERRILLYSQASLSYLVEKIDGVFHVKAFERHDTVVSRVHAGGPQHVALYIENGEGFEFEIVAPAPLTTAD